MLRKLAIQEIGSLKKPLWRLRGYRGERVSAKAVKEAKMWGRWLEVKVYKDLVEQLGEPDSPEKRHHIFEWSVRYALRLFESAGLNRSYTGEQARAEMYEHITRRVGGFEIRGSVNSLDYAYYSKDAITERPTYMEPIYLNESLMAKKYSNLPLKVPITGPYTMIERSFNEYYEGRRRRRVRNWRTTRLHELKMRSRRDFLLDLVDFVYRAEIRALANSGARWIQVGEPALTIHPEKEEMKLFIEAWN